MQLFSNLNRIFEFMLRYSNESSKISLPVFNSRYQQPRANADRQTYHRFLRWMIFSPECMVSQVLKVVLGWVYSEPNLTFDLPNILPVTRIRDSRVFRYRFSTIKPAISETLSPAPCPQQHAAIF